MIKHTRSEFSELDCSTIKRRPMPNDTSAEKKAQGETFPAPTFSAPRLVFQPWTYLLLSLVWKIGLRGWDYTDVEDDRCIPGMYVVPGIYMSTCITLYSVQSST